MSQVLDLTEDDITIIYRRGDGRAFKMNYPDGTDLSGREYAWQFRRAADDAEVQWAMDVDDSHKLDEVAPYVLFTIPSADKMSKAIAASLRLVSGRLDNTSAT